VRVDVGVDGGNPAQRRLVQILHDLELDLAFGLQRLHRMRERIDDRGRRQRIGVGRQVGLAQQMAHAPVEHQQLVVAGVLHHARDVAVEDRLIHRGGVDQCQVARVGLGELFGNGRLAGDPVVDQRAQLLFELGHQRGPFAPERAARIEIELLLIAHIRAAGAIHQHIPDLVEDLRERRGQPRDRQVPAVVEDLGNFARGLAAAGGLDGVRFHVVSVKVQVL
jgi:hypothetical protein